MKWACGYVQVEMAVVSAFSRDGSYCAGLGTLFTHTPTPTLKSIAMLWKDGPKALSTIIGRVDDSDVDDDNGYSDTAEWMVE